jgi:hypothetical protein
MTLQMSSLVRLSAKPCIGYCEASEKYRKECRHDFSCNQAKTHKSLQKQRNLYDRNDLQNRQNQSIAIDRSRWYAVGASFLSVPPPRHVVFSSPKMRWNR